MKTLNPKETAHILVDFQNDFVAENGTLSVNAKKIWESIQWLMKLFQMKWIKNIASKDRHPSNHSSFASSRWEEPTYTDWSWPDHCIAWTWWAELHESIDQNPDLIVHKWTNSDKEAYSAFQDTALSEVLNNQKIKNLIVTGVTTDYCVEATARDAIREWLRTIIISDAVKAVDEQQWIDKIAAMKVDGIESMRSEQLRKLLAVGEKE